MSTDDDDAIPVEAEATNEVVKSAEIAFEGYFKHEHTTSTDHVNDVMKHVGKGGVAKRASIFMASPPAAASPKPSPSTSPGGPVRRQSNFAIKMASTSGGGDKCKRCTLSVYLAEKLSSSNGIYHKRCFSCGLDSGNGCGRTLDAGNYDVYGGIVFCKTCSKKQHHGDKQMKTKSGDPMSPIGSGERRLSWNSGKSPGGGECMPSQDESAELPSPPAASASPVAPQAPQSVMSLFGAMSVGEGEESADEEEATETKPAEAETAQTTQEPAETAEGEDEEDDEGEGEAAPEPAAQPAATVAEEDEQEDEGDGEDTFAAAPELAAQPATAAEENEDEDDGDEGEDTFAVAPPAESPTPSPVRERRASIDPLPGQKSFHECPFTFPFDKNGAIFWVGSFGGAKEYENPQKTGSLYLEISTLYRGQLLNLTSYQTADSAADRIAAATYTNNTSRSWLVVDFGPERKLRPSYYCLKHGASGIGNAVRNWTLEGKVEEESPWVELRKHVNDQTMREEPQSVAGYELSSDVCRSNFFRIFRLTQYGKNSGGNDCLFIGGIDFYGIMRVEKAPL